MKITTCNCIYHCTCYLPDKKIARQRIEEDSTTGFVIDETGLIVGGAICVVTYATGEVQKLQRAWMDTLESHRQ